MNKLAQAIASKKVILFVGAGVSRNLKLPSWGELIAHIARRHDVTLHPYIEVQKHHGIAR